MRSNRKYGYMLLLVLLVAACTPVAPTAGPTQPPQITTATTDPLALTQTFEAISTSARGTIVAELTEFAPVPTETRQPTNTTVFITATQAAPATATSTIAPSLPSATVVSRTSTPANTLCRIVSQSPSVGQDFAPREDFDLRWTIQNLSGESWLVDQVDLRYVSGARLQRQDVYDLTTNVANNAEVEVIVDALAPAEAGRYNTTWAVMLGARTLCTLTAAIDVTP